MSTTVDNTAGLLCASASSSHAIVMFGPVGLRIERRCFCSRGTTRGNRVVQRPSRRITRKSAPLTVVLVFHSSPRHSADVIEHDVAEKTVR